MCAKFISHLIKSISSGWDMYFLPQCIFPKTYILIYTKCIILVYINTHLMSVYVSEYTHIHIQCERYLKTGLSQIFR